MNMRFLPLTIGLMMLASSGFAQELPGTQWSRADCQSRCQSDLDQCKQRRFGKTADGDCRIEGLRCRKACDVLAYLVGPPPGDGALDWAHYLTLWNVETSRILLAR
jgi:hypothetical protein